MEAEGAEVKLLRVPREENHEVDMIVKLVTFVIVEMPKDVLVETTMSPYTEHLAINVLEEKEDWRIPIIRYVKEDILLANPEEVEKVI